MDLDFHPGGETLLVLAGDGTTHLWEVASGNRLLQWPEMRCTHFSPDGELVASRNGLIRYQPASLSRMDAPTESLPRGPAAKVPPVKVFASRVAIHPDSRLAVRGTGSHVHFLDLGRAKPICRVKVPLGQCVFSADGRSMYGVTHKNELIKYPIAIEETDDAVHVQIDSVGQRVPLSEIPDKWPTRSETDFTTSRFAVVHATYPGMKFVDRQTGGYHELETQKVGGNWSDISPNGDVAATSSRRGKVRIWDLKTGDILQELESPNARLRFQPNSDDPILAATEAGRLRFFRKSEDSGKWEVVHKRGVALGIELPTYMSFSPNGRYFALRQTRSRVDLIDTKDFSTVAKITVPDGTMAAEVYFSPDASRLVVGTNQDFFQVWSLDEIEHELGKFRLGLESVGRPGNVHPHGMQVDWTPDVLQDEDK